MISSKEDLNEGSDTWGQALETYDFLLSINKTKYIESMLNKKIRVSNLEVKVVDYILPQATQFKYLWSVIKNWGRNRRGYKPSNSSWVSEMEESFKNFMWYKCTTQIEGKLY